MPRASVPECTLTLWREARDARAAETAAEAVARLQRHVEEVVGSGLDSEIEEDVLAVEPADLQVAHIR